MNAAEIDLRGDFNKQTTQVYSSNSITEASSRKYKDREKHDFLHC